MTMAAVLIALVDAGVELWVLPDRFRLPLDRVRTGAVFLGNLVSAGVFITAFWLKAHSSAA